VWREAVDALSKEEYRWPAQTVWAAGAGKRNIAIGHPTADNALAFTFRRGDPVYKRLVSTPGLRAFVTVDRLAGSAAVPGAQRRPCGPAQPAGRDDSKAAPEAPAAPWNGSNTHSVGTERYGALSSTPRRPSEPGAGASTAPRVVLVS
jgi:hypothetical protein